METKQSCIGQLSARRSYFESDAKFRGELAPVLTDAYEKASVIAARSARKAVSSGDLPSIRAAQWDEAVVQTLQAVLCCVEHTSDTDEFRKDAAIELPDRPTFNASQD